MIKLVTVSDIRKIQHLPVEVKKWVKNYLKILDEAYGSSRTELELGGFIAVIEDECEMELLKKEYYLDITIDESEWSMVIENRGEERWECTLYVMNTDYSIIVVSKKIKLNN